MTDNRTVTRKTPERKCTGCQGKFPKNSLIRVLRTPEGEIVLDTTGKKSGRGAYICKNAACFQKARKAGRFERNLECEIPDTVYDRLEVELSETR